MNRSLLYILAVLCITMAIVMFIMGSGSNALAELRDYWYVPLPFGLISLFAAMRRKV